MRSHKWAHISWVPVTGYGVLQLTHVDSVSLGRKVIMWMHRCAYSTAMRTATQLNSGHQALYLLGLVVIMLSHLPTTRDTVATGINPPTAVDHHCERSLHSEYSRYHCLPQTQVNNSPELLPLGMAGGSWEHVPF